MNGIEDTPFAKRQYFGSISFSNDYPKRRQVVVMITPNGRNVTRDVFQCGNKSWNPKWSVEKLLVDIIT